MMETPTNRSASPGQGFGNHPGKLTRLIIQVPCLNEAGTLAIALAALPRDVPGFDVVEWLIVDDGSTDATLAVARQSGVDHIVSHPTNRGLAAAFMSGLEASLCLGADVIVNTDADNQYDARDIPALTRPILDGEADMVVGARPIEQTQHFSWTKRKLQRLGSWAVRVASHTTVSDAPSGFRAISRDAAMRLNVFGAYTYTLETIIQAGLNGMRVTCIPVRTHPDLRPSRLVKSIRSYVQRSLGTIVRVFVTYRPLATFVYASGIMGLAGFVAGVRFLYFYLDGNGSGHVQSVILSALCLILSMLLLTMGLLADLISVNRKLLENILLRVRMMEDARSERAEERATPPDA